MELLDAYHVHFGRIGYTGSGGLDGFSIFVQRSPEMSWAFGALVGIGGG